MIDNKLKENLVTSIKRGPSPLAAWRQIMSQFSIIFEDRWMG
jgi:hypothetical protein